MNQHERNGRRRRSICPSHFSLLHLHFILKWKIIKLFNCGKLWYRQKASVGILSTWLKCRPKESESSCFRFLGFLSIDFSSRLPFPTYSASLAWLSLSIGEHWRRAKLRPHWINNWENWHIISENVSIALYGVFLLHY